MKNALKKFALIFSLAMIFASCSDNANVPEVQDLNLSQPLANNHTMDGIVITDLDKYSQTFEMPENAIETRSNCPAFDYAQSQYLFYNSTCSPTDLYCQYLKLFWQIDFHVAAINCGWSIYCDPTYSAFHSFAEGRISDLEDDDLHPSYVSSLENKLGTHATAFNNNC